MNIKFHDVIADLTGVSGLKVVRAILGGERNPVALLAICDPQIQKKKAERVCESLVGTWKEEHLFALRQALAGWEFYQQQIAECDHALEQLLKQLTEKEPPPPGRLSSWGRRSGGNAPQIPNLRQLLWQLCGGKDPTAIPGISDYMLLQLLGETGTDLGSHWKTSKQFTAWLGVAPGARQSGKRRGNQRRSRNRAGRLFCLIARAELQIRPLVDFTAASEPAVHGLAYVEAGLKKYHDRVAQTEQTLLQKLAKKHGMILQTKPA